MIVLGKNKVDENYNISNDGIITDLQGNIKKTYLHNGRPTFKGVKIHRILMYTKYGWRDGRIYAIHHKDENKLNNSIDNLEYLTRKEHTKLHSNNMSNETKQKISASCLGRHWKLSEETKIKRSLARKGKHHSEETKKKISLSLKDNPPNKGKIFSEEHKKKLSLSHKGQKSWNKGKTLSEETRKRMSESRKLYLKNLNK